jgi:hypothetical protein
MKHYSPTQKESWQTFEEASGHVRPERANKWPNSMTDIYDDDDDDDENNLWKPVLQYKFTTITASLPTNAVF